MNYFIGLSVLLNLALASTLQASSQISLRAGVEATEQLKSQISVEEAEKMFKDTTIYSMSVLDNGPH